ncbi:MAG TPA: phosphatidate cytidylyltransferase [Williamwhitmania sp.]|nr:phosphatidate cytidylyltransferase [Williamwhitmania sp.]
MKFSNFVIRTISGLLFALLVIGSVYLGQISFAVLMGVILIGSLFEFYRLSLKVRVRPQMFYGVALGLLLYITTFLQASGALDLPIMFYAFVPLSLGVFIVEMYRNHSRPFTNIAYTLLGVAYIAGPMAMMNYIAFTPSIGGAVYDFRLVMGFFFLLWANDTGAYLVGMSLGRNKLFPRISPKKSWEGFIGGVVIAVAVGALLSLFFTDYSLNLWISLGFLIAVSGVFGDLVESMYKRSLQVKDSGNIMPGHGGFLDRFDAVFFAAPIVFVYLQLIVV